MDMIEVPDAAELKNPGRFYLQVGYNELFALGQAAWAGAQYYPQEKRKKRVDKSIDILDNVGNNIKSLEEKGRAADAGADDSIRCVLRAEHRRTTACGSNFGANR
jgi:hypothetical protein